MSVVTRARVLRAGSFDVAAAAATPSGAAGTPGGPESDAETTSRTPARGRRMPAGEVDGRLEGKRIVDAARQQAAALLAAAEGRAAAVAAQAAEEARQAEHAKVSALYLAAAAERERRAEADLDRAVSLAVLLAERLLGQAIEQRPELIVPLARQALAEARGARRATIEAHPLDAAALERHLEGVAASGVAVDVRANAELTRGSLRVHTNLGTLDAQLTPQLERLAKALRDALEP